jgi:hypothetical protein
MASIRSHAAMNILSMHDRSQRYFATASGKNKQGAKGELEKLDFSKITCREAIKEVAKMYVL